MTKEVVHTGGLTINLVITSAVSLRQLWHKLALGGGVIHLALYNNAVHHLWAELS